MPMTADQAKAAVTEGVLLGVQHLAGVMSSSMASNEAKDRSEAAETFANGVAHLRQVEATAHRIIDKTFEEPKEEAKATESDGDYRARLQRAVGEGSIHSARLQIATGRELDDIGAAYSTKRR